RLSDLPPPLLSPSHVTSPSLPYPLSLHDALPIYHWANKFIRNHNRCLNIRFLDLFDKLLFRHHRWVIYLNDFTIGLFYFIDHTRSEEHTSELQSRFDLVCRLLLEKKNYTTKVRQH